MSGLLLVFEIPVEEISENGERIMCDNEDIISMLSYSQSDFGLSDRWAPASKTTPDAVDTPPHAPIHPSTTIIKSDQTPRIPRRPSQDEATMSSSIIKMDRSPQMPQRRCMMADWNHSCTISLEDTSSSSSSCDQAPILPRRTSDFVVPMACC